MASQATERADEIVATYQRLLKGTNMEYRENAIRCAIADINNTIAALHTTTGHCTLSHIDRLEVQSDFDFWTRAKDYLKEKLL